MNSTILVLNSRDDRDKKTLNFGEVKFLSLTPQRAFVSETRAIFLQQHLGES